MYTESIELLQQRGVEIKDIVECVVYLQRDYIENIEAKELEIYSAVHSVLEKREVQNALLTGIYLDMAVEAHQFGDAYIQQLIMNDAGLYGIDEVVAYGICNLYGSIALTNYGYIDKVKPGIIGILNEKHPDRCNTFLDDIVGAIAASAASKLAHTQ